jgi:hypothetical protein
MIYKCKTKKVIAWLATVCCALAGVSASLNGNHDASIAWTIATAAWVNSLWD